MHRHRMTKNIYKNIIQTWKICSLQGFSFSYFLPFSVSSSPTGCHCFPLCSSLGSPLSREKWSLGSSFLKVAAEAMKEIEGGVFGGWGRWSLYSGNESAFCTVVLYIANLRAQADTITLNLILPIFKIRQGDTIYYPNGPEVKMTIEDYVDRAYLRETRCLPLPLPPGLPYPSLRS